MKVYAVLLVALLSFMTALPTLAMSFSESLTANSFVKEIYVIVKHEDGKVASSVDVYLFLLAKEGIKLLSKVPTNGYGIARFYPTLPLKCFIHYCTSVNLMAVAVSKNYLGVYTFSVDPTYDLYGPKVVNIELHRYISKSNKGENSDIGILWEQIIDEKYKFTPVLRFATYDGILAKWIFPAGSKVRVQSKCRWPPGSDYPWYDCGYVDVTVDIPIIHERYENGRYLRTIRFNLKYRYSIIRLGTISFEKVYAVDENNDPVSYDYLFSYWSGYPVNGPDYFDIVPGDTRAINVTGGEVWDFSIAISFAYKWSVALSLGIDKKPAPKAYVYYKALEGYGDIARIVSLRDSDYLDIRVYWVNQ